MTSTALLHAWHAMSRGLLLTIVLACVGCVLSPVSWSPDGQIVAFQQYGTDKPGLPCQVWIADVGLLDPEPPKPRGRYVGFDCRPPGEVKEEIRRYREWQKRQESKPPAARHDMKKELTLIESSPGLLGVPTWSPDGQQVAFLRQNGEVVGWNLQTRSSRVLAKTLDLTRDDVPLLLSLQWTPGSRSLVGCVRVANEGVPMNRFERESVLRRIDTDTGSGLTLSQEAGFPSLSPNGKWVAAWGTTTEDMLQRATAGRRKVVLCSVSEGRERTLLDLRENERPMPQPPLWAPDSTRITVPLRVTDQSSEPTGKGSHERIELRVVEIANGESRTIRLPDDTAQDWISCAWPSGTDEVLVLGKVDAPEPFRFSRVQIATGQITSLGRLLSYPLATGLSTSPDGTRVAYLVEARETGYEEGPRAVLLRIRALDDGIDTPVFTSPSQAERFVEDHLENLQGLARKDPARFVPAKATALADCAMAREAFPSSSNITAIESKIREITPPGGSNPR